MEEGDQSCWGHSTCSHIPRADPSPAAPKPSVQPSGMLLAPCPVPLSCSWSAGAGRCSLPDMLHQGHSGHGEGLK